MKNNPIEERLVRRLAGAAHWKGDCAIYRKSSIDCYSGGTVVKRSVVPEVTQAITLWCDGSKLVMLGVAGLVLTMPGVAVAEAATRKKDDQRSSNSNNNNNG